MDCRKAERSNLRVSHFAALVIRWDLNLKTPETKQNKELSEDKSTREISKAHYWSVLILFIGNPPSPRQSSSRLSFSKVRGQHHMKLGNMLSRNIFHFSSPDFKSFLRGTPCPLSGVFDNENLMFINRKEKNSVSVWLSESGT